MENVQRAADQGTYTCTARNKHNYTSQRTVDVRVLGMLNFLFLFFLFLFWSTKLIFDNL